MEMCTVYHPNGRRFTIWFDEGGKPMYRYSKTLPRRTGMRVPGVRTFFYPATPEGLKQAIKSASRPCPPESTLGYL